MTDPAGFVDFVADQLARLRASGAEQLGDATDLAVSPAGDAVAFTALVTEAGGGEPRRRVAVLDLADGRLRVHDPGAGQSRQPCWSPAGDRLAWIAESQGRTAVTLAGAAGSSLRPDATVELAGTVEYLQWSPDGSALLLGVAEAGATRSDVHGSGVLPGDGAPEDWTPLVSRAAEPPSGTRRAWVLPAGAAVPVCVPIGPTVWQAAWAGTSALVAVVSDAPGESAWYTARLVLVDVASGATSELATPDGQLAQPAAAPSGARQSVLAGAMSDRGLDTGQLVVFAGPASTPVTVDTAGADVSDHHWLDDDRLIFAGLRGLETVVGLHEFTTGRTRILWQDTETCGDLMPRVAAAADTVAVTLHSYSRPPAIACLADGAPVVRLDLGHGRSAAGSVEAVHWTAPDGLRIDGLLAVPDTPGPHPLVVHVHGGPVWAWRNAWSMQLPYTPVLVACGYAVLHPNARGSAGRGQEFVRAGLHDMGGADALDLVAGVDALVAAGRVDPARVGVTGNSYGGFMAAWLAATSDRFAAAAARSPVTDWVSQHHASNLPGFDRLCLTGDPLNPASDYRTRSPLYLAERVRIPTLFTAGALDLATPPEQAAMLHRALVERGRDSTLVIYPQEGHGVHHHAALVDQCARIVAFFERHMPPGPPSAALS